MKFPSTIYRFAFANPEQAAKFAADHWGFIQDTENRGWVWPPISCKFEELDVLQRGSNADLQEIVVSIEAVLIEDSVARRFKKTAG